MSLLKIQKTDGADWINKEALFFLDLDKNKRGLTDKKSLIFLEREVV